jgi:hypothetical protein
MSHTLLFAILLLLAIPAVAQTPDAALPGSVTFIEADGTTLTVYSSASDTATPDSTVLISYRTADGKEHALRLRSGRLVLEGEADAMAMAMMKIFGEMMIAEMKRQGVPMPCPATNQLRGRRNKGGR